MLISKMPLKWVVVILLALTSCKSGSNDQVIKEATNAYEKAFNQKDAKGIGALWAEDAQFVVPEAGEVIEGRSTIEAKYAEYFKKNPDSKIEIKIEAITFPSGDEAVESGTTTIKKNGEIFKQTAFKAYYELHDGKWLIGELREVRFSSPPEASPHLKELAWFVGNWVDQDEDVNITSEFQWDKYKNFLTHKFTVITEGSFDLEGKEIIGWDPIKEKIRSWLFDSEGTFGEGTWRKQGDSWVVETSQVLMDGRRASSINIYTPVDKDKYTWQSTGRAVGGEILPDIEPVTVVRKKM